MSFPAELSNAIDGVTEIVAAHLNNLEAKVGIDNSAVVTSLDYSLKNAGSIDPGHKHTAGALSGGNNGEVLYKAAGVWGPGTPDAAGLVAKSGDQSIAGVKTFTSIPLGPASNPTTDNQLARKSYVDLMLPLAGGTMAGNIAMNNHKITGLAAASGAGEALRYDEWIATQDPGHKHSRLWASDGSPEAVIVDAVGNVGLGTVSPGAKFDVNGNVNIVAGSRLSFGGLGAIKGDATNLAFIPTNASGYILFQNAAETATNMAILNNGNVGIGTTSAKNKLDINLASGDGIRLGQVITGVGTTHRYIGLNDLGAPGSFAGGAWLSLDGDNSGNYGLTIQTQELGISNHQITFLYNGNVGINTTNPGYKLTCNGEPGANGYTAWTNYSDIRFKQDIVPLKDNILARVLKLNPAAFSYNDKNPWGEKPGARRLYGFIAQELQELFPEMVGEAQGPDGEKYLTTNLSNLTLYLVQAIKEQQAQIETLQTKLH